MRQRHARRFIMRSCFRIPPRHFQVPCAQCYKRGLREEVLFVGKTGGKSGQWPVLEPGTGTAWSDHDVTTEESSGKDLDSGDS